MQESVLEDAISAETDYEFSAIYTSAMDAASAGIANVAELGFWDCLGYIGMGMLEVGGAGAVLISASQLVPMILKLKNPHWDQKEWAQRMRNKQQYENDLKWKLGEEFMMSSSIRGYYVQNPTYVWVKDNGIMGQFDPLNTKNNVSGYKGAMDPLTWSYKVMPGSGLWKRARIITIEGDGAGFKTDSKSGTWAYLKFCDDVCNTDVDASVPSCWFRVGTDGFMLPDDDSTRAMCSYYNMNLLNAYRPDNPDKTETASDTRWDFSGDFESELFSNNTGGVDDLDDLRTKIQDLQSQIEPHSDLWWELEDASYKSIDDRNEIVETIRKAKDIIRKNRRRPTTTGDKPTVRKPSTPKSPKRPNRPGRDRRPLHGDFNGTAIEPDQSTTQPSVIHHVDLPSNIDQGTYDDTTQQELYSNAFQGGNGVVDIDLGWTEDFSGTRRRLPGVKQTDTLIPDWFMQDPSVSGFYVKPKGSRGKFWNDKPGAFYEWVRNTAIWLEAICLQTPKLKNQVQWETVNGNRYKTVASFQTALRTLSDKIFFRTNSRYEELERIGLQIATGARQRNNGRIAWQVANGMNRDQIYSMILNKAAGTRGQKETRWTMDDWLREYGLDNISFFEGGVKQLCQNVFDFEHGNEGVEFENMSYGFIPFRSRFGQLRLEDMNKPGGWDGPRLLKHLKTFVEVTRITPRESFMSLIERNTKPSEKFLSKYKLPPDVTLVTQNLPEMEKTISILEDWLRPDIAPELSFEDNPRPKSEIMAALDDIPIGEPDPDGPDPDEGLEFNAVESPPPNQNFVRRSIRLRSKSIGNLNEDRLLEEQMPENLIKQYTLDEVYEAYARYRHNISGFMPDGGSLDMENDEYREVWSTLGPDDPIIAYTNFTKVYPMESNPDHITMAWPNAVLDRNEKLPQDLISKVGYQYETFNNSPLDNTKQIALAMQIKGVVYRMMTIKFDDRIEYRALLTDQDYELTRIEQGEMTSNLTLVKSIFESDNNWSTTQFPAPFQLDNMLNLPGKLSVDLNRIIFEGRFEKAMQWCRKMNRFLLQQREKFSEFDRQVDDLGLRDLNDGATIEYETVGEYSEVINRIKNDIMPKLEQVDEERFQWIDIPEPQLFFPVERNNDQMFLIFGAITVAAAIYYLGKR